MRGYRRLGLGVALAAFAPAPVAAQVTVTVRVLANDAKLIGSGVGGARVTIRDAVTGEVLARGEHTGGTGDTHRLVVEPHERGAPRFDTEGAAGFTATLPVDTPTVVEIAAEGPLGYPAAAQRAATTLLVMPGQDLIGDGVVLTLHGFIVEPLAAGPVAPDGVPVRASVRMLCGCPFTAGGLWDAGRMTVLARVVDDGRVLAEAPLAFTGETNIWAGRVPLSGPAPAGARLVVLAADAGRANVGRSEPRALP